MRQSCLFRSLGLICLLLPTIVHAYSSGGSGYGGNSLFNNFGSNGDSSSGSGSSNGGYGGGGGGGGGGGDGGGNTGHKGPVTAAVETHRTVEVKPVQMPNEPHEPQVIEVPSDDMPVVVHFKSQSSRVLVQQTHTPAVIGEPEHTSSEDEPQRVIHEVVKPVVQEIREVIQPYRRLIQQIQPVIEQTHTVIAKGEPRPSVEPLPISGATGGSSGSGSSGSSGGSFNGNGHGSFGSGGGSKYGGNGGGGGNNGNYAASASTVSLKSAPKNQETFRKNNNVQQYSQHQQQQQQQQPLRHQASASTNTNHQVSHHQPINNNGRKLSIQQIFQHAAANQGPQQGSSNSQYSSRRGDFRESSIPAKAMSNRANFRTSLNNYAQMYQAPRLTPMQQYAYSDYKGAVSSLHEDDLPLMTFVAKPIRFRARARA